MNRSPNHMFLLMLMGVVIRWMAVIIGLFLRMNQLRHAVLEALASSQIGAPEKELTLVTEALGFTCQARTVQRSQWGTSWVKGAVGFLPHPLLGLHGDVLPPEGLQ